MKAKSISIFFKQRAYIRKEQRKRRELSCKCSTTCSSYIRCTKKYFYMHLADVWCTVTCKLFFFIIKHPSSQTSLSLCSMGTGNTKIHFYLLQSFFIGISNRYQSILIQVYVTIDIALTGKVVAGAQGAPQLEGKGDIVIFKVLKLHENKFLSSN